MPAALTYYAQMPKNKPLRQTLGEAVDAIMSARNMSQVQVAKAAKRGGDQIDQRTVGRIRNAEHPATVDTLESLAKALDVPAWQLLIPDGRDEKFLAILSAWEQADESGRRLLYIAATGARESGEPERSKTERIREAKGAER